MFCGVPKKNGANAVSMNGFVDDRQVLERLRQLRAAYGLTQGAFADRLGISYNRYNNIEQGRPLGKDLAFMICQKFPGVTLDWLFFGRRDGLPYVLAERIGELPRPSEGPSTSDRTRRGSTAGKK